MHLKLLHLLLLSVAVQVATSRLATPEDAKPEQHKLRLVKKVGQVEGVELNCVCSVVFSGLLRDVFR
jgi:hypothetical protein